MKRTSQISDLKKHIGFWMRLVSNNVSHSFAQKLAGEDVTVAEWVILREMFESQGPIAPSFLSDQVGLTRGAVSKLVDRLLKKRLLTRQDADHDGRYQEIELTATAKRLVPRLAGLADENDAYFFKGLSAEERKTLLALLQKVADANELTKPPLE